MADEELETTRRRSELMKRVRREGTEPELKVRQLLWHTGARFRVNVSDLPGTPDIANKSKGKAIFVHGCFWHHHRQCPRGTIPNRNEDYWKRKFRRNKERDLRKKEALNEAGFDVLIVWECDLKDPAGLQTRMRGFWFDDADV